MTARTYSHGWQCPTETLLFVVDPCAIFPSYIASGRPQARVGQPSTPEGLQTWRLTAEQLRHFDESAVM